MQMRGYFVLIPYYGTVIPVQGLQYPFKLIFEDKRLHYGLLVSKKYPNITDCQI